MCGPTAIPIASIVTTLVGTGLQMRAQAQSASFQQDIANHNAQQADLAAKDAVARGEVAVENQRNRVRGIMGSQRAAIGASGVLNDTGTTGDVLTQTATLGEFDAQTIRANALREAWGYKVQGTNFKLQGQLDQLEGQSERIGSLITGASRAYGIYAEQNPPTPPGPTGGWQKIPDSSPSVTKDWLNKWGGYP